VTTPSDPYASPSDPPSPGQPQYGQPQYGQPPGQPEYGQYGQPFAGGYGAPASPFGQPGGPQLAGWGSRVVGGLIDYFAPFLVAGLLYQVSTGLGALAYVAALAWAIYNKVLEGRDGQSYGKRIAGTRLLREQDGQPVGTGLAIGRYFLHIVDGIPCYLGYLWPLWDSKKQTFADKIVSTVVIKT
jgi:uncharacterized RDD family membrane protein YckC